MKKRAVHGLMIWLSLCSMALSSDPPTNCAIWPVDYDDATGNYLFYCEESPCSNGVTDCNDAVAQWAWYSADFVAWPEECPDCASAYLGYGPLTGDRGMRCRLGACESLCGLAPASMKARSGRCVSPRCGLCQTGSHDIQVRSPDGRQIISVRLFEATVKPACAGLSGKEHVIRCGFETERPVLASCRPFDSVQAGSTAYQVTVDYHGQKYIVLTKTRMAQESLASVTR